MHLRNGKAVGTDSFFPGLFEIEQRKGVIFDCRECAYSDKTTTYNVFRDNQVNQVRLCPSRAHSPSNKAKWIIDVSVRDLKT
jgi:hypothetical protein